MECPITTILLLTALGLCQGLVLVGEDKRQGLIPFPRVGRTFAPWIPPPVYRPEVDDVDDINLPEDVFTIRYTRGLFTPRLGRRKRSPSEDTLDKTSPSETAPHSSRPKTNVIDLGELLSRTPWAIVAYKDGVDKKMAFSPRLGRAMAPRLGRKRFDASEDTEKRAAAFAPRLGRAYTIEDSNGDDVPYQVSARAAFSPRLGRSQYVQTRASAFAPRLGRSDAQSSTTNIDSIDQQNV